MPELACEIRSKGSLKAIQKILKAWKDWNSHKDQRSRGKKYSTGGIDVLRGNQGQFLFLSYFRFHILIFHCKLKCCFLTTVVSLAAWNQWAWPWLQQHQCSLAIASLLQLYCLLASIQRLYRWPISNRSIHLALNSYLGVWRSPLLIAVVILVGIVTLVVVLFAIFIVVALPETQCRSFIIIFKCCINISREINRLQSLLCVHFGDGTPREFKSRKRLLIEAVKGSDLRWSLMKNHSDSTQVHR